MKRLFFTVLLASLPLFAQAAERETSLTIYSQLGGATPDVRSYLPDQYGNVQWQGASVPGYGQVREQFSALLSTTDRLTLDDVAPLLDPTTVLLTSLTSPDDTRIVSQHYQFDLVTQHALLDAFVGQQITVEQLSAEGIISLAGTLLNYQNGLTLQAEDGTITLIKNYDSVLLPKPTEPLSTAPTLLWHVATDTPGTHLLELSYQTAGLTWWANYQGVYHQGESANTGWLDLSAQAGVVNRSGVDFDDVLLKMVAGQVNRVSQHRGGGRMMAKMEMLAMADAASSNAPSQESLFEFHLYTLPERVSLPNNSMKQFELFPAKHRIPVTRTLLYRGSNYRYTGRNMLGQHIGEQTQPVGVYLSFENSEANQLGIPLPAGRVRVMARSGEALEFIGEDTLSHTAKGEEVSLYLGKSFDVKAERTQLDFSSDTARKLMTESFKIVLTNAKDAPVAVEIEEPLYRTKDFTILSSSEPYDKLDAHTIGYRVILPAGGEKTIRYQVEYRW